MDIGSENRLAKPAAALRKESLPRYNQLFPLQAPRSHASSSHTRVGAGGVITTPPAAASTRPGTAERNTAFIHHQDQYTTPTQAPVREANIAPTEQLGLVENICVCIAAYVLFVPLMTSLGFFLGNWALGKLGEKPGYLNTSKISLAIGATGSVALLIVFAPCVVIYNISYYHPFWVHLRRAYKRSSFLKVLTFLAVYITIHVVCGVAGTVILTAFGVDLGGMDTVHAARAGAVGAPSMVAAFTLVPPVLMFIFFVWELVVKEIIWACKPDDTEAWGP